ncbi:hypothetical protein FN846DRAFT_137889 [Sphaerosporella brunnea]|uniref:Uncharacterized protein n=1 Tax=Sphaerosporella brunnea TaxID=1250544 RepID=A0A5J5ERD9_9PEZI|nr:hypothetical protein FN846DRAFT_137889 [Sphaerosporella brunnea]
MLRQGLLVVLSGGSKQVSTGPCAGAAPGRMQHGTQPCISISAVSNIACPARSCSASVAAADFENHTVQQAAAAASSSSSSSPSSSSSQTLLGKPVVCSGGDTREIPNLHIFTLFALRSETLPSCQHHVETGLQVEPPMTSERRELILHGSKGNNNLSTPPFPPPPLHRLNHYPAPLPLPSLSVNRKMGSSYSNERLNSVAGRARVRCLQMKFPSLQHVTCTLHALHFQSPRATGAGKRFVRFFSAFHHRYASATSSSISASQYGRSYGTAASRAMPRLFIASRHAHPVAAIHRLSDIW